MCKLPEEYPTPWVSIPQIAMTEGHMRQHIHIYTYIYTSIYTNTYTYMYMNVCILHETEDQYIYVSMYTYVNKGIQR